MSSSQAAFDSCKAYAVGNPETSKQNVAGGESDSNSEHAERTKP